MILPAIAQTKLQAATANNVHVPKSKSKSKIINTGNTEDMRTCLSYVFSICACNKNREVIMAATADILIGTILALQESDNFAKICEQIARTSVTILPLHKKKDEGALKMKAREEQSKHEEGTKKEKEVGWAVLKLLVKFLKRFQRYLTSKEFEDGKNQVRPFFHSSFLLTLSHFHLT